MPTIVGVRFKSAGKIYYFSPKDIEFQISDGVIVETIRGVEYGRIVIANREIDESEVVGQLKEVIRLSTSEDDDQYKKNNEKKEEAMKVCREKIAKHDLQMKLIDVEFTFDNTKVIFYFMADGRIDFRDLAKDLASVFRIRIELRQIGIRDVTKMIGGLGSCGRPCCCSSHLGDFERVSIKMAKIQGLSLNPGKISGLCGRLMCCLKYENEHYSETSKMMPKLYSEIATPDGKAIVESVDLLRKKVKARFDKVDGGVEFKEYTLDQIKAKITIADDANDDVDDDVKDLID
ncbi:MAG: stage 0 sporulation family protein [Clostridia bacterium]